MKENHDAGLEGICEQEDKLVGKASQLKALMEQVKLEDPRAYAEIVHYDEETGVFDKEGFEKYLMPAMVDKAEKEEQSLFYALIDVDHGKQVNDTYGHDIGDYVFREVNHRIMNNIRTRNEEGYEIRDKDITGGRIGGDETALAFYGVDAKDGANILERLRQKIEEEPIHTDKGDVYVTVSIGAAGYQKGMDDQSLKRSADESLYLSKEKGRNQVSISQDPTYNRPTYNHPIHEAA